jgi:DNA-binding transcriptional MocR family regulator
MPAVEPNRAFLAAVVAARDSLPFGQRPTDTHVRVAAKLAFWRSANVSHRSLSRAAKCSRRTVIRALARLRALGLLDWTARTVCGRGWTARIANAYHFAPKPLSSTSLESIKIQCSANLSLPSRQPPGAGLAEVAQRRLSVLAEAWRARKAA